MVKNISDKIINENIENINTTDDIIIENTIPEVDEIKTIELQSLDTEENAIMIMVSGWVRRVYFDLSWKDKEIWKYNYKHYKGRNFTINYIGDFNDAHTVKLLPIKSL